MTTTVRRTCGLLGWLAVMLAAPAADAASETPRSSVKDLRVLSDRWVCAVIDTTAEVLAARDRRYAKVMKADKTRAEGNPRDWYYSFSKTYHTLAVWSELRPRLVKQIDSRDYWKVNGETPEAVSYWPQSVDGFPAYNPSWPGLPDYTALPRIADFVYLKLPAPLRQGERVEVAGADGRRAALRFDERATVCWSLRVNQVGYRPDAPAKYAYLGMWLGGAGPADFAAFKGKPFHLHAFEPGATWRDGRAVGEPAFSGIIRLRKTSAALQHQGHPISGEDVYELDFSTFHRPGHWCVVVPGLGRSWPFRVDKDVYGEAFYTMMKGLYIQRCGCELRPPYTAWSRPPCHRVTFRGGFPSEAGPWYNNPRYAVGRDGKARYGFRDEDGKPVAIGSFTVVHCTGTKEVARGVRGGWHDAADYDRRLGHYHIVWDLCGAYEMFPAKFGDGQLNMPESGNGVPDILDEAAIQVDLFRSTQNEQGGVSGWVEQDHHPGHGARPDQDRTPFFLSLPDRGASFTYAAAAAYLGRLLAPFDAARSRDYIESARRAYAWASDPANAIRGVRFKVPKGARERDLADTTVLFDERPDLPLSQGGRPHLGRTLAALQLYAATGAERYRDDWDKNHGPDVLISALPDALPPFAFVTPTVRPKLLGGATAERLKRAVLGQADLLLKGQDELGYRNLWRPPGHGYFQLMAWGSVHSAGRARFPVLAWRLTRDVKYRRAVLLGTDWELGCNELGRAMATGLGSVRPVFLQHIHSQADGILEPTPGIAPFALTYGIAPSAWRYQLGLIDQGHPSVKEYFKGTAVCLLPAALGRDKLQAEMDRVPRRGDWQHAAAERMRGVVEAKYPIFRRTFIHPFLEPGQNEFTVSETIAPHAAVYGCLLPDDWKPGKELKERKPITDPDGLPLYPQP